MGSEPSGSPRTPGPSCRAVLLGTARYTSAELPDIPAVTANLDALREALTTGPYALLPPNNCQVLGDSTARPISGPSVGAALAEADREAEDLLLVYYAGHGLLDRQGKLHLALPSTDPDSPGYTAIPLELVQRDLAGARARTRILILDCCFSGRAVVAMATPGSLVTGQLDLPGTYTLTSTTATAPAHAPAGERFTAFTAALLEALAIPDPLTLDEIHAFTDRKLLGRGLPRPQRRAVNAAGDLLLRRSPAAPRAAPVAGAKIQEVRFDRVTGPKRRKLYAALAAVALFFDAFVSARVWSGVDILLSEEALGAVVVTLLFLLPVWGLVFAARLKPLTLLLDGDSLRLSRERKPLGGIPWAHIAYLGVLDSFLEKHAGGASSVVRHLLIVRLDPDAGVPSWHTHFVERLPPNGIRSLGYVFVCRLDEIEADPVRLRQGVEALAGPIYRSNRELIEWDHRLRRSGSPGST
ncbi:caspase, EACC1-associated type [Streptomyces sp. NBC_00690]|uniref:caspase, EACC1-associated type n=1 Tax=Streptomyces sp. NBC_00690 TaxID=2975808 RepID=UPI002E2B349E|nr:caspase family protein [Streptomyces sp. NBC_00690]